MLYEVITAPVEHEDLAADELERPGIAAQAVALSAVALAIEERFLRPDG